MKYEKYLIQVCKSMLHDFEVVQCYAGDCKSVTGNILEQAEAISRGIWTINYVSTNSLANYKLALEVPKDFVEKQKSTAWRVILDKYQEK
jgi:hypothetical protein